MTAVGTMITGRYRLVEQLAIGGMGSVWKAWDELLQRPVAVKQLLTHPGSSQSDSETARLRVIREARITARLHHPHAVTLYDVVEQDGHPCLIMQYVPSKSLSTVLRETGTLDIATVTRIGTDLASALAAAHLVGIVHRDVKPGNVLITEDGSAKLTDFGISHAVGDVSLTSTGMVSGTPAYLAPEVARGEPSGFPADVFSLAATMYAALEGFPPFGSDPNPMALLHRVASGQMLPPQRSGPLTPLLLRMLSTRPADRPPMAEVLTALTNDSPPDRIASGLAQLPTAEAGTDRRTVQERAPNRQQLNRTPAPTPALASPATPVPAPAPAPAPASPSTPAQATTPTPTLGLPRAAHRRPDETGRRRRPVATMVAAVIALLVVASIVVGYQMLQRGDDVAGTDQGATTGPSEVSAATSASAAAPAAPITAEQTAPEQTAPEQTTLDPTTLDQTKPVSPSSAPISTTATTSAVPSPTTPAAAANAAPTSTQLAATIADYYAAMPGDTDAGWARLTPAFQTGVARDREYYQSFWDGVARVTATDITGTPPDTAEATITYTFTDGRVATERTAFVIVRDGDSLRIDDSTVLTSSSS